MTDQVATGILRGQYAGIAIETGLTAAGRSRQQDTDGQGSIGLRRLDQGHDDGSSVQRPSRRQQQQSEKVPRIRARLGRRRKIARIKTTAGGIGLRAVGSDLTAIVLGGAAIGSGIDSQSLAEQEAAHKSKHDRQNASRPQKQKNRAKARFFLQPTTYSAASTAPPTGRSTSST